MRPLASALAALLLVGPSAAAAQGVSLAPKFGSTGLGGDVVLSLAPKLSLKGGVGFLPFEFDLDMGGQTYTVEAPPMLVTGSVDIRVAGPLRIMAGLLYRSDDTRFAGDLDGDPVEIGDETFSQTGRLEGALIAAETAPYVGMGLGSLGSKGFHMYVDLGLAFAGDPDVELTGSGPITEEPNFEQELEKERLSILADTEDYYRYWPILNVGFRIGF
ncbi:MAG: hypothetical protein RLN75_01350 [Longimicrobiales bacterium]